MCRRENFSANRVLHLQVFDPVRSCGGDNNTSDIPATDGPPCSLSWSPAVSRRPKLGMDNKPSKFEYVKIA